MNRLIIPVGMLLLLSTSCDDNKAETRGRGVDEARTYFTKELGDDADKYEEVKWGAVEARPIDFTESRTYKMYQDTLVILEARLTELNDSANAEFTIKGDSPLYKSIMMRKTALDNEVKLYRDSELTLRQRYDLDPEYDGYWIYHEYYINGESKKAYILFRDTATYEPMQVIYR